jgi:glycosyltransferase involved in cell wall biosynthesis
MFFVCESSGFEYQPPRQLAIQLARHCHCNTVLVAPPTRWTNFGHVGLSKRLHCESPTLCTYSPYELPRRFNLAALTDDLNLRRLRREMMSLRRTDEPAYVIYDRPTHHNRVGLVREKTSAYYAHCDYTVDIVGRTDQQMAVAELAILRKVDVAFAASPILMERFSQYCRRVIHLSCGYDANLFDAARVGPVLELAHIPPPRILLSGFISGRVDFEGLIRTVQERPDWHFVIAGSISGALAGELRGSGRSADLFEQLCQYPNVHYIGAFPLAAVPGIIASCDVGLVPYCLSAFTMASSPIKTFEYLAMGKPVVSTAAPESLAGGQEIFVVE